MIRTAPYLLRQTLISCLQIPITNLSAHSFLSPIVACARIPHDHPKCPRDSKRPTARNGAELMSSREIDRFLTECHLLPSSCLGVAVVNKLHLIRICSFPVSIPYACFWSLRKPGVTHQLSCSYRRPAVSPAITNA